jgi:hypothetical protein
VDVLKGYDCISHLTLFIKTGGKAPRSTGNGIAFIEFHIINGSAFTV